MGYKIVSTGPKRDLETVEKIVSETLRGNSDAGKFLGKAQRALILSGIYRNAASRIQEKAQSLALKGKTQAAEDGIMIANRLNANANIQLYNVANRIRSAHGNLGEFAVPEDKNLLRSFDIVNQAVKLRSGKESLIKHYNSDARFFVPLRDKALEKIEKVILFRSMHTKPLLLETIPTKIKDSLGITTSDPTMPLMVSYFESRNG